MFTFAEKVARMAQQIEERATELNASDEFSVTFTEDDMADALVSRISREFDLQDLTMQDAAYFVRGIRHLT